MSKISIFKRNLVEDSQVLKEMKEKEEVELWQEEARTMGGDLNIIQTIVLVLREFL